MAKKGSIIVVENRSVWTSVVTGKRTETTYYFVAEATMVDSKGIVLEYNRADSNYNYPVDPVDQRVFVIGDKAKQAQAKKLYKNLKDNWFGNADEVRKAILAA